MVSTYVYMMSASDTSLAPRLARLSPEPCEDCVTPYVTLGAEITRSRSFRADLRQFSAMADRSRLLALRLLERRKELCACEIQAALGVSHATVSHHMSVLEEAGLVSSERRGRWIYYRRSVPAEREGR